MATAIQLDFAKSADNVDVFTALGRLKIVITTGSKLKLSQWILDLLARPLLVP